MMLSALGTFRDAVMHSPIFAGGAALGAVGGTIAALRRLPQQGWNAFLRTFSVTAEIPDTDAAFNWMQTWLDKQPASKRIKNLTVNTSISFSAGHDPDETPEDRAKQILLTPAVGNHLLRINGKFLWLTRQRNEGGKDGMGNSKKNEYWNMRLFGRDQNIIRSLVAEAREIYRGVHKRPHIMVASGSYWESLGPVPERELESVVLPDGMAEAILSDADKFLRTREWYNERGVPYRRGYMLAGPPGTGKSSFVTALSHHMKKPVYVVNLGAFGLSDDNLVSLLCNVPSGALVLFEDIDATSRSRVTKGKKKSDDDEKEKSFVSLSGLLNALDGLVAKEGRITIMTTNHPEKLDPALTRPGRVDKTFILDYATEAQASRMFNRFFQDEERSKVFGHLVGGKRISPATIQEHMLQYREDAAEALNQVGDLMGKAAA
jgi:chaperone BCS1